MAFFVSSHDPSINATGVYRNGQLVITFNKRISTASVDWQKLSVNDSYSFNSVPGELSLLYNASGHAESVVFTPVIPFTANNKYTVYVYGKPNGIVAYDNDQIDNTYSWEFTTGTGLYDTTISGGLPSGEVEEIIDYDPSGLLPSEPEDVIGFSVYSTTPQHQAPNNSNDFSQIAIEFTAFVATNEEDMSGLFTFTSQEVLYGMQQTVENYTLDVSGNMLYVNMAPLVSGQTPTLSGNTQYTITLDSNISGHVDSTTYWALGSDYGFWFTSTYCPLFTTPQRVKMLTGPFGDQMLDDTIYRMIHKNSLDAVELYNMSYTVNFSGTAWGCTHEGVPVWLRRYVECKTAYDVLAFVNMAGGGQAPIGGSQSKMLGDMSIKYGGGGSSGKSISGDPPKSKMEELYECYNEAIRMIRNMKSAVRGYWDNSKGFHHPVHELHHNRVIRPVSFNNSNPRGPWWNGYEWQGYRY